MKSKTRHELEPLKISCTSSDCNNNLHCFRKSRNMAESDRGKCRSCGADLIDWNRIHKRDLSDVQFTIHALKLEMVRHYFWHVPIDPTATTRALEKTYTELENAARVRLTKTVAPTNNPWDGRQTPYSGNIIYYAQHAVACCCRRCIEYWYGIPRDVALTDEQTEYFVNLMMMFIQERLSTYNLGSYGDKVVNK
ncbi:MAG: DUF4186 family protein [Bellilinea sp.]